ncbi:MAG: helix-turn-helix domain-containing protein [Oscillospiraceae bacterium]|nr:helix-turn-helix domain-containing protein [Oscillospiraceae bacterium]
MNNLGDMLDYAVNDCGFDAEDFFGHFIVSGVADAFERGSPKYVAGLSGPELASEVIYRTLHFRPDKPSAENIDKSPEYWAGWILAYYQWQSFLRFSDILKNGLTLNRVLSLYPTLHEADISKFVTIADRSIKSNIKAGVSNLQRIRKAGGMTQKELAEASGTALRMVQLYEQRKQDINKAQAITLARMAHVLGCFVEDLLEIDIA